MLKNDEQQRQLEDVLALVDVPPDIGFRLWREEDFPAVQMLSIERGWSSARNRSDDVVRAWRASWPALVATNGGQVIGFLRAVTDGNITTYIAELLVSPAWQRRGVGGALLNICHHLCPSTRLDLLSTDGAGAFYEALGFRSFPGFRKSYQ